MITVNSGPVRKNPLPDLVSLAFTEHAPQPMITTEGPGHIVRYVNPAFCRLIHQPKEQFIGKSFGEILPEKQECLTLLDRVFQTGKPASCTEGGDSERLPFPWSFTIWPMVTGDSPFGAMIQVAEITQAQERTLAINEALVLGSVRQHELTEAAESLNAQLKEEIRQRKEAEKLLHQAQARLMDRAGQLEGLVIERTAELTATNSQLEAFVYSIAHDLRAPLRSMQGFSTMLVEEAGPALNETGKNYAERIEKSAQFMDAMLKDLLAFSRVSQKGIELTPINPQTVVESVLDRLGKDIRDKNARVENSGPWPCVLAHELTLTQIVFNLTSNALKFVAPNVSPVVRLRTEVHAEFIRVWVEDNGLGIAPDYQGEIFRIFTRLDGDKYGGTGIGLAIVQKGVERMGGRVGVESIPRRGSRFWFELRRSPEVPL
jgi:signal transduction histidine kinase